MITSQLRQLLEDSQNRPVLLEDRSEEEKSAQASKINAETEKIREDILKTKWSRYVKGFLAGVVATLVLELLLYYLLAVKV